MSRNSREALETQDFLAMLDAVEGGLKEMGATSYAGVTKLILIERD